ncbi:squalene/phytoene synthase family protein [Parvularcula maris]|uniref:Squalene/phytoene synthase family protein n=1 Tax=Parvularcula maris TaxID=2965077 RepID=A0A9X2RHP0_9PROT|nr:squalene/phytoene synthase family protein [Parvularcula maris]MCQ8185130.1 squalene/phytoene synthase family protein [Parvularcula maris]
MKPDAFAPLTEAQASYLLELVEGLEPDWLLPLPYVPGEGRGAWLSILGFAAEVIASPARVSNGMLGRIRLQWWREALEEVFGSAPVRQHPVVEALSVSLSDHPAKDELQDGLGKLVDGLEPFLEPGEDRSVAESLENRRGIYVPLSIALEMVASPPQPAGSSPSKRGSEDESEGSPTSLTHGMGEVPEGRRGLSDTRDVRNYLSAGNEALLLHALCRIGPAADATPQEDGTEPPSRRFARALGRQPELEAELAAALDQYRRSDTNKTGSLSGLPLTLFRTRGARIERRRNPLAQRLAILRSALTGRS